MPRPVAHPGLPANALDLIAARFRALGEPSRLKLLNALQNGPQSVSQLIAATRLGQANVSRHLQTLTKAGLLARERRGATAVYAIADPSIFALCRQVCGGIQKRLEQQAQAFQT